MKKVRFNSSLSEEKMLTKPENPVMQKSIAKSLNTSAAIINDVMNQHLQFKKN